MVRGRIFNLQRYSLHDGPGIRTTVFLKGCPLHCPWCHNPESLAPEPELVLLPNRCLACGACRAACPWENHSPPVPSALPAGQDHCAQCGACVDACPAGAREIVGRDVAPDQLLQEILADRMFFEESGGGVTFSGGEPLSQPEFLLALLAACRREALHTAVDTSGLAPRQVCLDVARLTHLVLYDLKVLDDARHRALTGVSNRPILDNLQALDEFGTPLYIRVPIIPGFTDSPENLTAIAQLVGQLKSVRQISLLPYHRTGRDKATRLGRSPATEDPGPTEPNLAAAALRFFDGCRIPVRTGR